MKVNILHLTLKKKWFDMIASGEKKEEYREIKPYWKSRLEYSDYEPDYDCVTDFFEEFDIIVFKNGYSKNADTLTVECKSISVGNGKKEWGAPDDKCYIIKLGKIFN